MGTKGRKNIKKPKKSKIKTEAVGADFTIRAGDRVGMPKGKMTKWVNLVGGKGNGREQERG